MKKELLALLCAGSLVGACSTSPPVKPAAEADEPPEAAAPPPVAQTPAPQPLPQNAPFSVSMDTFFDFDKATLRPEGMAALDDLARRLAVTRYDTLTIVGHADRIGSVEYNLKLSERRAGTLRDYLIAQGIDGQKIAASGIGKSQPTAACPNLSGARLIDCLQPDRNAELTASGTEALVLDTSGQSN
jgi:OmpA-OmpF porin, OOP family